MKYSHNHKCGRYAGIGLFFISLLIIKPVILSAGQIGRLQSQSGGISFADNAIVFNASYVADYFIDAYGGLHPGGKYMHLLSTPIGFSMEKLAGLKGGTIYVLPFWPFGGDPSDMVGDLQELSSIEAPDTWKVYEAWFQQELYDSRFSALFGLYDLNSEFENIDRANLFISSSFGIDPEFSQTGANGPSIFPTTALALRLEGLITNSLTARIGIFNGVAGDPNDPYGNHIMFNDGLLLISEVDYTGIGKSRFGVGTWMYTSRTKGVFDRELDRPGWNERRNKGIYFLGEYSLYSNESLNRELGVFARAGYAYPYLNRLGYFAGAGITIDGLLSSKFENSLGLGIVSAFNGKDYKEAQRQLGAQVDNAETIIEGTALLQLQKHIQIQPDIQYVINPNTDPTIKNALVVALRVILSL